MELDISFLRIKTCQLNTQYEDMQLKDSRCGLERLIAFTLLDYGH